MDMDVQQLRQKIQAAFLGCGLAEVQASLLADELAEATASGYESHGIGRVAGYVENLRSGRQKASPRPEILRETPATALLDGDRGIGVLMALEAADLAARKAHKVGIAAVALRNSGDMARLAPYADRIARKGLLALVMVNDAGGGAAVAPHGSAQPLFSTNPLAAGIPRQHHPPIVFDFATSQLAIGGVKAAARRGIPLPEDILIRKDGASTSDPGTFLEELSALLPLGGARFGFKGTALALLVDILAGGLSGDGVSGEHPERDDLNALFLIAIDPAAFADPIVFYGRVEGLLDRIRASEPRPGFPPVRVPGEGAVQRRQESLITVHDGLWAELCALAGSRS